MASIHKPCKEHGAYNGASCVLCAYDKGKREGIAEGIRIERERVVKFIHDQREATLLPGYDPLDRIDKDVVRATMAGLKLCIERAKHAAEGGE